jgi:CubicO group peptidase (beta-lactamase class C family)
LFQMASVSKWVTSWGVLALVQQGRLELDAPVSRYLTRWRLPPSEFDNDGVTVRRLLSHTAGLTDRLGYFGFPPGTPAQSLEDSLTYATDHTPIADGHARVGYAPGSRWLYSGGGFTLLQLLIEEVTHDRFAHFMQQTVLDPLGMTRSTFDEDAAMARGVATFAGDALPLLLAGCSSVVFRPDGPRALCACAFARRRRRRAGTQLVIAADGGRDARPGGAVVRPR